VPIGTPKIDKTVGAGEGTDWWENVQAELEAVIAAPTTSTAARLVAPSLERRWRYASAARWTDS